MAPSFVPTMTRQPRLGIGMDHEHFRRLMSDFEEAVSQNQALRAELGRKQRDITALREEVDRLLGELENNRRKHKEIVGDLQHEVELLQQENLKLHESLKRVRVEQHSAILRIRKTVPSTRHWRNEFGSSNVHVNGIKMSWIGSSWDRPAGPFFLKCVPSFCTSQTNGRFQETWMS